MSTDSKEVIVRALKAAVRKCADGDGYRLMSCNVGGQGYVGAMTSTGEPRWEREEERAAEALKNWFYYNVDPELGTVAWFWAGLVDGVVVYEESGDELPPQWMCDFLNEKQALDPTDPYLWCRQWAVFDERPVERLPQWWIAMLQEAGGWDAEEGEPAVNADGEPLHGRAPVDLDQVSDEILSGD